jgi:hypothetical protein
MPRRRMALTRGFQLASAEERERELIDGTTASASERNLSRVRFPPPDRRAKAELAYAACASVGSRRASGTEQPGTAARVSIPRLATVAAILCAQWTSHKRMMDRLPSWPHFIEVLFGRL